MYIIDNCRSEKSECDFYQFNEENQDELENFYCDCKKLINSSSDFGKNNCSTIDCSCFNRNYHNGKHFVNSENGLLDLDYSFPIIECSDDCGCNSTKCRNKISPPNYIGTIDKPLYLFSIERVGFGVKCKKFIRKGEFISEYIGQVLSDEEANIILNSAHQNKHHYVLIVKEHFQISKNEENSNKIYETRRLNINAEHYGNVSRFFNHSCDPNLTWRVVRTCSPSDHPRLFFFAAKDIPQDTELTFDYGEGNQNSETGSQQKCLCKSLNCKGFLPLVSI